jgi:hypothetical protein
MNPDQLVHHYCDLNEIPFHASRDAVVDYLVAHPTHTIAYLTPYGWIFDLIHQFVRGEIDLEKMMTSGDMNHAHNITLPIIEHADCLVFDSLMADKIWGSYDTMIEIL